MNHEKQIESIVRLSPMQEGMLFHTLLDGSGVYFQQLRCHLDGELDRAAFREAWKEVLDNHPVLRSAFVWERHERPLRVVLARVSPPFEELDLRALSAEEQERELARLLRDDRSRGFDLARAPLMRLLLVRLSDRSHRLVWSHHHLLLDGWSTGLVLGELQRRYQALRAGRRSGEPAAPPHDGYVAWLDRQDRQDLGAAEAFWRRTLAGFTAPTPLGIDRSPGEPGLEPRFRERRRALSPALRERLSELARRNHLTLNALCAGAWALLLARYSGEREVVFGVTVAGRPEQVPGIESMIGLFINTLPLRVPISERAPAVEWLLELQRRLLEIRRFEHTPLTSVRAWSEVPRGLQLFESIFVYENYPVTAAARSGLGGLTIGEVELEEQTNYALSIVVEPQGEGLLLRLLFDGLRFDETAIDRCLEHLEVVLAGLAEPAPHDRPLRVGDVPLLAAAERARILEEWPPPPADYARDDVIHALFERRARATPDAVAVVDDERALSYREVDEEASRYARHLASLGIGRGAFVGVFLSRSADMVPALLGVLKSGAAYLPIEPSYPAARVDQLLATLDVACVLTQRAHLRRFDEIVAPALRHLVCVDRGPIEGGPAARRRWRREELDALPGASGAPDLPPVSAEDLAYVIFTSGSSGTPKGVMVRHRPVINLISWVNRRFSVGPADRVLFLTSLCFDLSVYDVFGVLAAGGAVRVVGDRDLGEPERLVRLLCDEPITFWDSAPAALSQLAPFLPPPAPGRALRLVFLSGDWVPLTLPARVRESFPGAEVIALGGATEATVWSNYFPVGEIDPRWVSIPYGRPIQNARYHVLDGRLEPCPIGVPGDLYIGGECLATGYANAPELTAERFVPDPFRDVPGARLYRTGDIARYFSDGNLEFLGRRDQQVKVRGYRIELGEVETALARHPGVRECLVAARKDGSGERGLSAYVVVREGASPAPGELRAHLKSLLPPYMVPASFHLLAAFPVTSNGKVDRNALLALDVAPPPGAPEPVAAPDPPDPIEELVTQIWAEVLGVERLGALDDFFEMGGHSLLATRATARLREVLGLDLPLRAIFEAPTAAAYAALVRARRHDQRELPRVERAPRRGPLPLSHAQARLWFLQQLDPDSAFYHVPLGALVEGRFDRALLARCLGAILERHEVLRASYHVEDGRPVQVVAAERAVPITFVDLGTLPAQHREADGRAVLEREARRPFDLARDCLLRATVVRLADERHLVLLLMHHIVSDGWSMGILLREILALYRALAEDRPPALPALPIQYTDYAAAQRAWLEGARLDEALDRVRRRLAGAPALALPTDRPRPDAQRFLGRAVRFALGDELARDLRALARREGVTLFMTLLGAFQVLLGWLTGQEDIVVGTDIANRTRGETEELIGFFVNQLVLRTDLSGNPSFQEQLRRVRQAALDAYADQDVPFDALVRALNPERDTRVMPLFQVKLVLQNAPVPVMELPELRISPVDIDTGTAKYDLMITFEDDAALAGTLEYDVALFEAATMERFLERYRSLLERVVAAPRSTVAALGSMLADSERQRASEREREVRRIGLERLRNIRRGAGEG